MEIPRPSSDQLARILGCKRSNTTKRWLAFTETAEAVVPAIRGLTRSGRPDRTAEKTRAFARDLVRLARETPDVLEQVLRRIARRDSEFRA